MPEVPIGVAPARLQVRVHRLQGTHGLPLAVSHSIISRCSEMSVDFHPLRVLEVSPLTETRSRSPSTSPSTSATCSTTSRDNT